MSYLGIDLGTTYSAVSRIDASGRPAMLPNHEGEQTTPSAVLFDSDRDIVVGREALRAAAGEPEHVALDVKRYMGDREYPRSIRGQTYSPVLLSAMILKKLVQDASARIGEIEGAVVTVPAYFNEARRHATAAACAAAGIPLIDIINEPTAAALGFAYEELVDTHESTIHPDRVQAALFKPRTLVVYDLGGGTFDVTVLRCDRHELRVLATAGDVHLGGRDWDQRIADHLAVLFEDIHGTDPRDDETSQQNFREAAETLKIELSARKQARYVVHHGGHTLNGVLTRAEFEKLTADLLFRTRSRLTRVMKEAGVDWSSVDELLTVGGSTRMPAVIDMLGSMSGLAVNRSLSPDTAVARGAAVHAAVCAARGLTPQKSTERATDPSPTKPPKPRGGVLAKLGRFAGVLRVIRTVNVSAHTLGVIVHDRDGKSKVAHMIPRNTALPAVATRCFGTQKNHQRRVTVQVVEGESVKPEHAYPIGNCLITELPEALPLGSPVEVQFKYDTSGRLQVHALHVTSGTWAQTSIERQHGIDPKRTRRHHDVLAGVNVS